MGALSVPTSQGANVQTTDKGENASTSSVAAAIASEGNNGESIIVVDPDGNAVIQPKGNPEQSKKIESEKTNEPKPKKSKHKGSNKKTTKSEPLEKKPGFKGFAERVGYRIEYMILKNMWGVDARLFRSWGYGEKEIKAIYGISAWDKIAKAEERAAREAEKERGGSGQGGSGNPNGGNGGRGRGHGNGGNGKGGHGGGRRGNNGGGHGHGKGKGGKGSKNPNKPNPNRNPKPKPNTEPTQQETAIMTLRHSTTLEQAIGTAIEKIITTILAANKNESIVSDLGDSKQMEGIVASFKKECEDRGIADDPEKNDVLEKMSDMYSGNSEDAEIVKDYLAGMVMDTIYNYVANDDSNIIEGEYVEMVLNDNSNSDNN